MMTFALNLTRFISVFLVAYFFPQNNPHVRALVELLRSLSVQPFVSAFRRPVSAAFEEYHRQIHRPMDLATIKVRRACDFFCFGFLCSKIAFYVCISGILLRVWILFFHHILILKRLIEFLLCFSFFQSSAQRRLLSGQYAFALDVLFDMRQVVLNCVLFNNEHSTYTRDVRLLADAFYTQLCTSLFCLGFLFNHFLFLSFFFVSRILTMFEKQCESLKF